MLPVNYLSASALAQAKVDELARLAGDDFQIMFDATREVEQGWVFFFNTADYLETRNPSAALAGNGPILVTRDGVVNQLPSDVPWNDELPNY